MSIKILYRFGIHFRLLFFLVLFLSGCARQSRIDVGYDDYKMSLFELENGVQTEYSYKMALVYINKAIEKKDEGVYFLHKATLLFLLKQYQESLVFFDIALKKPLPLQMKAEGLNNYACLLASQGETKRALEIFSSLESDKNYFTPEVVLVNQAKIFYGEKRYVDAKNKLLKAVSLAPDYVDARYYLALVYYEMKNYKDSLLMAEYILKLISTHDGAMGLSVRCRDKLSIC